jgi:hypothetical protein
MVKLRDITEEELEALLSAEKVDEQPKFEQDPYLGNFARTTVQGLSAGFGDEGEAMLRALYMAGVEGKDYSKAYEEALSDARKNIEAFRETNPVSAYGSEIGASLIGAGKLKSIPALMGYGGFYGYGASEGDLISEERLIDAGQSAAFTGVTAKALQSVTPTISDAAQKLKELGVRLTPGQLLGGSTKRFEQGMSSVPIAGAAVDRARTDAIEDFNRVVINNALMTINKKIPDNISGREAFKFADDILRKEYNNVLAPIKLNKTTELDAAIDEVIKDYSADLSEEGLKRLKSMLKKNVTSRFGDAGTISGEVFKEIDSTLGRESSKLRGSQIFDDNKVGEALKDIKDTLFDQVAAQNKNADKIRNVDLAYKRMIPVEKAVEKVGGFGEVFTPAQLLSGVKSSSPRVRGSKRKFARGEADMQELAEQGKEVLGGLPDSGTARNLLNAAGVTGLLGETFAMGAPITSAKTLASVAPIAAAYSRAGVPVTRETLAYIRRFLPELMPTVPATSGILFGD